MLEALTLDPVFLIQDTSPVGPHKPRYTVPTSASEAVAVLLLSLSSKCKSLDGPAKPVSESTYVEPNSYLAVRANRKATCSEGPT